MLALGKNISRYRKNMNMSQKVLAKKLGLERSAISQYERNMRQPSCEVLISISDILGITVDELLGVKRKYLDVSGLDERDIEVVKSLIETLKIKQ